MLNELYNHRYQFLLWPCVAVVAAGGSLPVCAGCKQRIYDEQYLQALNADWHTVCFRYVQHTLTAQHDNTNFTSSNVFKGQGWSVSLLGWMNEWISVDPWLDFAAVPVFYPGKSTKYLLVLASLIHILHLMLFFLKCDKVNQITFGFGKGIWRFHCLIWAIITRFFTVFRHRWINKENNH